MTWQSSSDRTTFPSRAADHASVSRNPCCVFERVRFETPTTWTYIGTFYSGSCGRRPDRFFQRALCVAAFYFSFQHLSRCKILGWSVCPMFPFSRAYPIVAGRCQELETRNGRGWSWRRVSPSSCFALASSSPSCRSRLSISWWIAVDLLKLETLTVDSMMN